MVRLLSLHIDGRPRSIVLAMLGPLTLWWFPVNTTRDIWTRGKLINPSAVNGGCILLNRTATRYRSWEMSEKWEHHVTCTIRYEYYRILLMKDEIWTVAVSWLLTHTNNDTMILLPNLSVATQRPCRWYIIQGNWMYI